MITSMENSLVLQKHQSFACLSPWHVYSLEGGRLPMRLNDSDLQLLLNARPSESAPDSSEPSIEPVQGLLFGINQTSPLCWIVWVSPHGKSMTSRLVNLVFYVWNLHSIS